MKRTRRWSLLLLGVLCSLAAAAYGLHRFREHDKIVVALTAAPGLPAYPKTVAQQQDWQRAALQRLASELRRHPSAKDITVRYGIGWAWGHWFDEEHQNRLVYKPGKKHLQGFWMNNCLGEWEPVTPEHLQRLAAMQGIMDDLTRFGCRNRCP